NFTRHEVLDDLGDVLLEWDISGEDVGYFRVTARTKGYVGIGFNDNGHMKGADIILTWVDDHSGVVNLLVNIQIRGPVDGCPADGQIRIHPTGIRPIGSRGYPPSCLSQITVIDSLRLLFQPFQLNCSRKSDSHGDDDANASPITDASQDVKIVEGFQNNTHTSVTFSRAWQTCDPDDYHLTEDSVRVIWAMHESDPELSTPVWHHEHRGSRKLRIRAPADRKAPAHSVGVRHWDVKLNQFAVDGKDNTVYWCKIFAAPVREKHHMIGYEPLIDKGNEDLVHHIILYECASTSPTLKEHARIVGTACYTSIMPREWDSCIQPIVVWTRGSKGSDWLPEHVGLPVAEHQEGSYYMLQVHYNNPGLKKAVDSSGVRLHLTSELRPQEAGIFVSGIAVSPLHLIPPKQKEYATAGYCDTRCTDALLPKEGVNAVSVVLHSHLAGRKMSLKHIREGKELPHIVRENRFDFDYQQSHSLQEEVKILPGDELVTECVYGTEDRTRPTMGGYAATQEMCLAFVVYYPRTQLAGCYSTSPPKDFFKTLGVYDFKGVSLDNLEKLFLTSGTDGVMQPSTVQQLPVYPAVRPRDEVDQEVIREAQSALKAMDDFSETEDEDVIFTRLVIDNPEEFRGRTLAEHLQNLPWTEELLARSIERSFYRGRHMTFCRRRDDKLALPSVVREFPNYTALVEPKRTVCSKKVVTSAGIKILPSLIIIFGLLMRRTRFTVLPVRSWQYVGLMVVSLACMTLGLVSRDRAGRSGSLAGPELKHTAPHEVDACPNELAMLFRSLGDDPAAKGLEYDYRIDPYKLDQSRISRSRSLDRVDARRIALREVDARLESRRLNRNLRENQRLNRDRQLESHNRIRSVESRQNRGEIRASVRDRRVEETRVRDLRNRDVSRSRRLETRENSRDRWVDSRAVERRLAEASRVRESRDERRVASRSLDSRERRVVEASRVRDARDERRVASRSLDSRERRIVEASRARESLQRQDRVRESRDERRVASRSLDSRERRIVEASRARESTRRLDRVRESRNERRVASRSLDSLERRVVEGSRVHESRDERRAASRSLDSRERRIVEASRVRESQNERRGASRSLDSRERRVVEASRARESRDERRSAARLSEHREKRSVEASRVRDERRVSEIRGRDARDQRFSATRVESLGKREAESSRIREIRETRNERRVRDNNAQRAPLISRIRRESISRE
ncbi:GSCOCG00004699001-RA-CDS, partial [Cotesia congregata]